MSSINLLLGKEPVYFQKGFEYILHRISVAEDIEHLQNLQFN